MVEKKTSKKTSQKKQDTHIVITITNRGKWLIGIALALSWYMPFLIDKLVRTCGY